MLSAAAPQAALGPCFGTVEHVIRLEQKKKKNKVSRREEEVRSGSG